LAVFDRMTQLGFDLAGRLEGRLVDDNGRAVSEDSLNRDRARLVDRLSISAWQLRGIPGRRRASACACSSSLFLLRRSRRGP
jgi:hypothetical protein